jgi:hypothetical protein
LAAQFDHRFEIPVELLDKWEGRNEGLHCTIGELMLQDDKARGLRT